MEGRDPCLDRCLDRSDGARLVERLFVRPLEQHRVDSTICLGLGHHFQGRRGLRHRDLSLLIHRDLGELFVGQEAQGPPSLEELLQLAVIEVIA